MIVFIVVLVLAVLLGLVGLFYIGPIVKFGINEYGPQITKVPVKVDTVNVSLLSGSAAIKGFVLGNPKGYASPQAIDVENVSVSMDPLSVTSSKLLIHSVKVKSPVITFEQGLGINNLNKILSNLNESAKNPGTPGNQASNNSKPAQTIEIDDFTITGAKVRVYIPGVGGELVPLPDIHLTDLGKNNNGLTPVQLSKDILVAILKDTVKVVSGSLGSVNKKVGNITGALEGLLGK